MAKSNQSKASSSHPADPHHADAHHADAGHGGHHAPVETAEMKADRARSAEIAQIWAKALSKPGALIALVFGSLSLAWLASLSRSAPELAWTWLLVMVLAFAWGLALARGGCAGAEEAEPPATGGGHH